MKRLVLAIDCDDVLIPTAPAIISAYNKKFKTSLELSDFYGQNPIKWGVVDIREASDRVGEFLRSPEHAKISPSIEAQVAIHELAKYHELHLVTGRSQILEQLTIEMMTQFFAGCFTSIELTNFYDEQHRRGKGDVCRAIGADILIDDHVEHIDSALQSGVKEVIIFGDYPWNQMETPPSGATRCADWAAVTKEIERIAQS